MKDINIKINEIFCLYLHLTNNQDEDVEKEVIDHINNIEAQENNEEEADDDEDNFDYNSDDDNGNDNNNTFATDFL